MARKRYYVTTPTTTRRTKDSLTITKRIYELHLTDAQAAHRILKGHKVVDADADDAAFDAWYDQDDDSEDTNR